MKRQINLEEISDGRLYALNDMVKVDCGDCRGCFSCCQGMGGSIVLDPFDIFQLTSNLKCTFEQLLNNYIELNRVDNFILPNLKMIGGKEQCVFLNEAGRCSIHSFRPGICRIFPLGRYYTKHSFQYFLQVKECRNENRSKMKVYKWIDMAKWKDYDRYIADWHYFLLDAEQKVENNTQEDGRKKAILFILNKFYAEAYTQDFSGQFYRRLEEAKEVL